MDKERLKEAMATAPRTLTRKGEPVIGLELACENVFGLNFMEPLDPETYGLVEKVRAAAKEGSGKSWSVTAEEIFKLALEIPKNGNDSDGEWFASLPYGLCNYIIEQRCGRSGNRKIDYDSEAFGIRARREPFLTSVRQAIERGSLWEFGVIIEDASGGIYKITISTPWDDSNRAWHLRLSPDRIFVGREELLDYFSIRITGKPKAQADLEAAFCASDLEVWWNEVGRHNHLVAGRFEDVRQQIGLPFSERVIKELRKKLPGKQVHETIRGAKRISGYYVKATESDFPGAVDLEVHFDSNNWVRAQRKRDNPRSLLSPDTAEKDDTRRWIFGGGTLGNCSRDLLEKEQHGDNTVFIFVDGEGNIGQIQMTEHRRLSETTKRTFHYYIDNPDYGDGVNPTERLFSSTEIRQLDKNSMQKIKTIFIKSLERTGCDSEVLRQTAIPDQKQKILLGAMEKINQRLRNFGMEEI